MRKDFMPTRSDSDLLPGVDSWLSVGSQDQLTIEDVEWSHAVFVEIFV